MYGTNIGPALVSGIVAWATEAIRRKEIVSKYVLINAAEVVVTSWAGNAALSWMPGKGFIGLGATVSSAAIAGLLYAVSRRYIQDERDMKASNFTYGAAMALAGELISAPVFTAIGSTSLSIGSVEVSVGAERRGFDPLPASNVNAPPGSATPVGENKMGGQPYANPNYWF